MDKNVKLPLVSVIMPVYNSKKFVGLAIESILNQTYRNFEFIIINDFSTDNSLQIISSYKDSRIKILNMNKNSGISKALNEGIKNAKGKYIARMDSDDISFSNRLERQVGFLESNKEYILCGSNYKIISSKNEVELPEKHSLIKTNLLKNCCVAHPTVVFKKEILVSNNIFYSEDKEPAEDYFLWTQLIQKGKFYNLQENLLDYRVHYQQISQSKKELQDRKSFLVKINYIKYFYKELTNNEIKLLEKLLLLKLKMENTDIKIFSDFILELKKMNRNIKAFESRGFKIYISDLENMFLINYFGKNERYSLLDFFLYLKIFIKFNLKFNFKNLLKLFIKSISFYKIKSKSL